MIHPYNKHQLIPERDISAGERLEPARAAIRHAVHLLRQFEEITTKASDSLTEEQLQLACDAAQTAYNAACNCAFLGLSGYNALPVEKVEWRD